MLGWSTDDIKQFISIIEHTTSFTAANVPNNERPYEEAFKFLLEKGIINVSANDIPYDNSGSGLIAEDVQAALDELKQIIEDLEASDIAVVPSGSLVDTNVQAALQTIYGEVDLTKTRITTLENGKLRVTYYEIIDISSATSGTITKPTGSTIIEAQFGGAGNSVLSTLTGSNTPTFESPKDGLLQSITANLDVNGNYVASDTYASPVALLYVIEISYINYINNADENFVIDNIRITADIPVHNDLSGLQGGTTNEYYHLTAIELGLVNSALQPGDNVSELINNAGYLTSFTETDPVFSASVASGITGTDISNWNTAFGWGDHASAGYLTGYTETDPIFLASPAAGITSGNITNWNSAYTHISNTSNPHNVTKTQVGLGNVDNVQQYPASNPNGYETPAQLNSRDTANRSRANHTGTQLASTISDFAATVRSTVLTGITFATNVAVLATDSILIAIGKLQAQINYNKTRFVNTKLIGGSINANISQTIYSDAFISFVWDATNKQLTYVIPATTPLGTWFWHDASILFLRGSSTQQPLRSADDISSATGTFYFTTSGILNNSFDMNNYGATQFLSVKREQHVANFPGYSIELDLGDIGNLNWVIKISNANQVA